MTLQCNCKTVSTVYLLQCIRGNQYLVWHNKTVISLRINGHLINYGCMSDFLLS